MPVGELVEANLGEEEGEVEVGRKAFPAVGGFAVVELAVAEGVPFGVAGLHGWPVVLVEGEDGAVLAAGFEGGEVVAPEGHIGRVADGEGGESGGHAVAGKEARALGVKVGEALHSVGIADGGLVVADGVVVANAVEGAEAAGDLVAGGLDGIEGWVGGAGLVGVVVAADEEGVGGGVAHPPPGGVVVEDDGDGRLPGGDELGHAAEGMVYVRSEEFIHGFLL